LDRLAVQDHNAIAGADDNVSGTNLDPAQIDWLVQCTYAFFFTRAYSQTAAEDRKVAFGDRLDVPHRAVDYQPGDTSGLCGHTQHLSPRAGVLISFDICHQHAARGTDGHRVMQHEVVPRRTAHRNGRAAYMGSFPHGADGWIHHASLPGGLVQG